jgi:hypothetical protein
VWIVPSEGVPYTEWNPHIKRELKEELYDSFKEVLKKYPPAEPDQLESWKDTRLIIPESADAHGRLVQWYTTELKKGEEFVRLETYLKKLLLIKACSELKDEIDLDLVNRTFEDIEWQARVRREYKPVIADNPIAKMEQNIKRCFEQKDRWARGELYYKVHAERAGIEIFDRALENLQGDGFLSEVQVGKVIHYTKNVV